MNRTACNAYVVKRHSAGVSVYTGSGTVLGTIPAVGADDPGTSPAKAKPTLNTGPFRHRSGFVTVRAAIPWTGIWDEFVAYAALIDLDITEFVPGPDGTLTFPSRLCGISGTDSLSLCRGSWIGYLAGRSTLWAWAPEYFRYEYLGGPKPRPFDETGSESYSGAGQPADSSTFGLLDLAKLPETLGGSR